MALFGQRAGHRGARIDTASKGKQYMRLARVETAVLTGMLTPQELNRHTPCELRALIERHPAAVERITAAEMPNV
jgi:hypothetical protein